MAIFRVRNKEIRRVRVSDLEDAPWNFRTHPSEQEQALAGLISEIGFYGFPDVYETEEGKLRICDGHLRKDLLIKEYGPDTEIDVNVTSFSEAEAKKATLTKDPLAAMADADTGKLESLLAEVETDSDALQTMLDELALESGIEVDEPEIVDPEAQIDRAEELRKHWGTARGQLWIIKGKCEHRLLCGDSTDAGDVERVMGGEKIDTVFTSPPYNSGNGGYKTDYKGKTKRFYHHEHDNRTESEWVDFCDKVLRLCANHLRTDESTVVWNVMYTARCRAGYGITMFAGSHGMTVKETICWDKQMGFPTASKGILSRRWELIFVLSKGEKYNTTQGEHEPRWNKWDIPRPQEQEESHRATFPIQLPVKALSAFGGRTVYDPFLGSGTTMVAAEQLSRRCFGIEISDKYTAVILERMKSMGCECEVKK